MASIERHTERIRADAWTMHELAIKAADRNEVGTAILLALYHGGQPTPEQITEWREDLDYYIDELARERADDDERDAA